MQHLVKVRPARAGAQALPSWQPLRRVLVVEDDSHVRSMITSRLADHRCLAVGSSGSEMARRLQSDQFSLVVLDVWPAAFDRFDRLRQIRACSDVPVILITGPQEDGIDRVVGRGLGADDFLRAPFDLRELLARAPAVLRPQQAGRQAMAASMSRC